MTNKEHELPRPEWAPLDNPTAFNLPADSVGYHLLTEEYGYLLGGRLRPVTIFNQVPTNLRHLHLWTEARKRGLSDAGDVLRLSEHQLASSNFSFHFVMGLHDYIEGLAIPPHTQLVNAVFGTKYQPTPFPPALEQEFIQTVEEQLNTLKDPRGRNVLIYRFGLYDGLNRSKQYIGSLPEFNVSRERISQIERKALRMLRHPIRARHLEMFMPFPKGSLGRAVFGSRLRKYLDLTYDLPLPDPATKELERYGISARFWLTELKGEITDFQQANIDQIAIWLDHGLCDLRKPPTPKEDYHSHSVASQ